MRILLDECIDEAFRHHFPAHDCQTCRYTGLKGLTNGQLLDAAERAGFHALITVDQKLPFQQRIQGRRLSLILLTASTTNLDDLVPLLPNVLAALHSATPGSVIRVTATGIDIVST